MGHDRKRFETEFLACALSRLSEGHGLVGFAQASAGYCCIMQVKDHSLHPPPSRGCSRLSRDGRGGSVGLAFQGERERPIVAHET